MNYLKKIFNCIVFVPLSIKDIVKFIYEVYKFYKKFNTEENCLDKISSLNCIIRKVYYERPNISKEDYVFNPCYHNRILLYAYEESNTSLRKRIMKHIKDKN